VIVTGGVLRDDSGRELRPEEIGPALERMGLDRAALYQWTLPAGSAIPPILAPGRRRTPPQLDRAAIEAREVICSPCMHRDASRCRLMGCGCALSGRMASPMATCPAGLWPPTPTPTP
jgi:hypothetical protein